MIINIIMALSVNSRISRQAAHQNPDEDAAGMPQEAGLGEDHAGQHQGHQRSRQQRQLCQPKQAELGLLACSHAQVRHWTVITVLPAPTVAALSAQTG